MPVACKEDLYWLVVKAVLKLAVLVNGLLLDFLKLLVFSIPHRHKTLLQPGGRFWRWGTEITNNLKSLIETH